MEFQELPGVRFSLSLGGEDIPILPDGRIDRRINEGTSLILVAEVFSGLDQWHPFTVNYDDSGRRPIPSRPTVLGKKDGSRVIQYQKKIPFKRTARGNHLVTYGQHNNIRMMFLNKENIVVVTVALIVQNGTPWLTADVTYEADIKDKTIEHCRPWPTLFHWVEMIHGRLYRENQVELSLPEPDSFAENTGLVVWWDSSMANAGSGCVMTKRGQVSVHWSSIRREDTSRRFLKVGERVSFDSFDSRRDSSNFSFQLRGVTPNTAAVA